MYECFPPPVFTASNQNWRWVEPRNKSRNGLRAGGGNDWKVGMGMISQVRPLLFSCCMLIMEMIVR